MATGSPCGRSVSTQPTCMDQKQPHNHTKTKVNIHRYNRHSSANACTPAAVQHHNVLDCTNVMRSTPSATCVQDQQQSAYCAAVSRAALRAPAGCQLHHGYRREASTKLWPPLQVDSHHRVLHAAAQLRQRCCNVGGLLNHKHLHGSMPEPQRNTPLAYTMDNTEPSSLC